MTKEIPKETISFMDSNNITYIKKTNRNITIKDILLNLFAKSLTTSSNVPPKLSMLF